MNPRKAQTARRKEEKTEKEENTVPTLENDQNDDFSWYFNRQIDDPLDRLESYENEVEKEHLYHWFLYFIQKLIYFWFLFYKFYKKIDDYLENENSNFVIFANGHGLTNMTTITQRHARKCPFDMTPVLSGYKVNWPKMTKND